MKALFVHAHFDDYEFTAAGTFEMWRQRLGSDFRGRVVVCTDGQAGHHRLSRAATGRRRLKEQRESARLGGYEFTLLRYANGRVPREGCLEVNRSLLAALWKEIREFEPDYLFCPPLPEDPLVGVHVDHVTVAEAVRKVAYLINVPHAFRPEYPCKRLRDEPQSVRVPVIINVSDSYLLGRDVFDFAVDVEPAFEQICRLSWCHQSQIREWIPWVGRHDLDPPSDLDEWREVLRIRMIEHQRRLGIRQNRVAETFRVTAWGEVRDYEALVRDLPALLPTRVQRLALHRRLRTWRGT